MWIDYISQQILAAEYLTKLANAKSWIINAIEHFWIILINTEYQT